MRPKPADIISRPGAGGSGQDAWSGFGAAWTIIAEMLAAIAVWGAIGFGIDAAVGTTKVFLPIGLVLGASGGIYLVWLRHGRNEQT